MLYKLRSIVLLPLLLLVLSKVSLECFLTPWAVDRVGDRRKCGDRLVLARVLEELAMDISIEKFTLIMTDIPMSMRRDLPCCDL